ncbi:MAG: LexA family transcriptional regulator [Phycisphaerae bacterium]|nr:LexA family transcriptional regulator [Phycisphaerae bacterium]
MSLGQIIRQKRESLKMTLDEVSRHVGYSKPYLSTIETGRVKNPPADDLLIKLEQTLQFTSGDLLRMAHLEKMPADVRQAFENNQAEVEYWRGLVRKLAANDDNLAIEIDEKHGHFLGKNANNCQQMSIPGLLVPVINKVSAGYPVDYDDMGYPPGAADDYVRCPDLHDANAFAVRVVGDSMEPKYKQGDIIVFSPNINVNSGDDCFVRLTDPHETTFKQVFFNGDGKVRLQPRNHKYAPMVLPEEKINGIYKAVIRYETIT